MKVFIVRYQTSILKTALIYAINKPKAKVIADKSKWIKNIISIDEIQSFIKPRTLIVTEHGLFQESEEGELIIN